MRLLRSLVVLVLLSSFGFGGVGVAKSAEIAPLEVSLHADPIGIEWPAVTETTLRMTVKSGPEGADFRFDAMPESGPIHVDRASLDGPGTLRSEGAVITDLMPGACISGGFQGTHETFRLILPPDSETTVSFPVRAVAASLSGIKSVVKSQVLVGDSSHSYRVEIPFGGKQRIQIKFEVTEEGLYKGKVRAGAAFRLIGQTVPAIPGLRIDINAHPHRTVRGPLISPRQLASTVTDEQGRFRSEPVVLEEEARWTLMASPVSGGTYDDGFSCGPVLETKEESRIAYLTDLAGWSFRSVSVSGTKLVGQKKVLLSFSVTAGGRIETKKGHRRGWLHSLTGRAGCNTMSGRYWINDDLLWWSKKLKRTKKRCRKPVDTWLAKNLQRGMEAKIERERLVLRGRGGLEIVLRRLPR